MIALGCDHGGLDLKNSIIAHFKNKGIPYKDFGCYTKEAVDYPDVAQAVCQAVIDGACPLAILTCGTGIGMGIAANKIRGIRAACCSDPYSAKLTREHNDANVLCLGGRVIGEGLALMIIDNFLGAGFEGGRHLKRIEKISSLEQ